MDEQIINGVQSTSSSETYQTNINDKTIFFNFPSKNTINMYLLMHPGNLFQATELVY